MGRAGGGSRGGGRRPRQVPFPARLGPAAQVPRRHCQFPSPVAIEQLHPATGKGKQKCLFLRPSVHPSIHPSISPSVPASLPLSESVRPSFRSFIHRPSAPPPSPTPPPPPSASLPPPLPLVLFLSISLFISLSLSLYSPPLFFPPTTSPTSPLFPGPSLPLPSFLPSLFCTSISLALALSLSLSGLSSESRPTGAHRSRICSLLKENAQAPSAPRRLPDRPRSCLRQEGGAPWGWLWPLSSFIRVVE